jgi:hypothetical protein
MSLDSPPLLPPAAASDEEPTPEPSLSPVRERVYDSFVVRVWHDPAYDELLRVEVEHAQSGVVRRGDRVRPEWIIEQLRTWLDR